MTMAQRAPHAGMQRLRQPLGDVARLVAEQKLHRVGDVAHLGKTIERAAAGDLCALLVGQHLRHVGLQDAGRHRIDGDAERTDLAG